MRMRDKIPMTWICTLIRLHELQEHRAAAILISYWILSLFQYPAILFSCIQILKNELEDWNRKRSKIHLSYRWIIVIISWKGDTITRPINRINHFLTFEINWINLYITLGPCFMRTSKTYWYGLWFILPLDPTRARARTHIQWLFHCFNAQNTTFIRRVWFLICVDMIVTIRNGDLGK